MLLRSWKVDLIEGVISCPEEMEQDLWVRDRAEVSEEAHGVEEAAWAARSPQDQAVSVCARVAATGKAIKLDSPATARLVRNAAR